MPDYVGAATIAANGPPPDAHIASISYLDLRVAYTIDKITARLGVNKRARQGPAAHRYRQFRRQSESMRRAIRSRACTTTVGGGTSSST